MERGASAEARNVRTTSDSLGFPRIPDDSPSHSTSFQLISVLNSSVDAACACGSTAHTRTRTVVRFATLHRTRNHGSFPTLPTFPDGEGDEEGNVVLRGFPSRFRRRNQQSIQHVSADRMSPHTSAVSHAHAPQNRPAVPGSNTQASSSKRPKK